MQIINTLSLGRGNSAAVAVVAANKIAIRLEMCFIMSVGFPIAVGHVDADNVEDHRKVVECARDDVAAAPCFAGTVTLK